MLDIALQVRDGMICFPEPLTHAAIIKRRNRFIIDVGLGGSVVGCHCPTTGRIGTLVLDGLPCLLSDSRNTARTGLDMVGGGAGAGVPGAEHDGQRLPGPARPWSAWAS